MGKSMDVALKVAENQNERELNSKLSARMKASSRDTGVADSLTATVAAYVAGEQYDRGIETLNNYIESKSEYPQFAERSDRYIKHCIDLVNAVRAKRSFPGMQYLNLSKQQELYDRAMHHFEELRMALKKIETIEREVRLEDVRSTVWVIKAAAYSVFLLLLVAFFREVSGGVLPAATALIDDGFSRFVNLVFDKLGF
jgi:hypothetical protein